MAVCCSCTGVVGCGGAGGGVERPVDGDDAVRDDRDVRQRPDQGVLQLQVELAGDDDDLAGLVALGECLSDPVVGGDVVVVLLPAAAVVGVVSVRQHELAAGRPVIGVALQSRGLDDVS
jgi:hypothetical protein